MNKKWRFAVALLMLCGWSGAQAQPGGPPASSRAAPAGTPSDADVIAALERGYQRGADAKRINDVHVIAERLEAYQRITGHTPYSSLAPAGSKQAVTIIVGAPAVERELVRRGNPLGQETISAASADLLDVLRPVLGAKMALPVDPQRVNTGPPNAYYIRLLPAGGYLVVGYLRTPTPHTTEVWPTAFAYALRSEVGNWDAPVWSTARTMAEVPVSERALIRMGGEQEEAKFRRYMEVETQGGDRMRPGPAI